MMYSARSWHIAEGLNDFSLMLELLRRLASPRKLSRVPLKAGLQSSPMVRSLCIAVGTERVE